MLRKKYGQLVSKIINENQHKFNSYLRFFKKTLKKCIRIAVIFGRLTID